MRLVNYSRGYNAFFDCSINGRIIVSNGEWGAICQYARRYAFNQGDFSRFQSVRGGRWYNIRATATWKVAKRFNLKRYKPGNYVIEVTN